MAIAILLFVPFSICLYVAIHRFWTIDTSDETIKYADTVATRIGVIHAVVIGYFLTLLTLYLPPPTTRRCILVSLYSSMMGVVLLGIFILTHPYSPAAGIDPDVFTWLLDASQRQ
jgi:hypothetical protein